jgi:hypothetical protein
MSVVLEKGLHHVYTWIGDEQGKWAAKAADFLFYFRMVVLARWTRVSSVRGLWVTARPLLG